MRTLFHPFLPNGPAGDPLLFVDIPDEGHSVMIDAGDLGAIPKRKLQRVNHLIVTHTHMDHFIGFDPLLRALLGRERELKIVGPAGIQEHVRGKLSAYTWNLIENYPVRLVVEELTQARLRSVVYAGSNGWVPQLESEREFDGVVHAERAYTMHVAIVDHGIPTLAVALRETERLSVNKDRLLRMGLAPGPWLSELKQAVRRCHPADTPIDAQTVNGTTRRLPLTQIASEILTRTAGQRLAYLTDLAWTPQNRQRACQLAAEADLLVCEAAFLDADRELARQRNHLTARQAGELARVAGVRRLAPFHFSPRYHGREQELLDQAGAAFGGPLVQLPRIPGVTGPEPGAGEVV